MNYQLAAFMAYLVAEVGASANTISAYRCDLEQYDQFVASRGRTFLNV